MVAECGVLGKNSLLAGSKCAQCAGTAEDTKRVLGGVDVVCSCISSCVARRMRCSLIEAKRAWGLMVSPGIRAVGQSYEIIKSLIVGRT